MRSVRSCAGAAWQAESRKTGMDGCGEHCRAHCEQLHRKVPQRQQAGRMVQVVADTLPTLFFSSKNMRVLTNGSNTPRRSKRSRYGLGESL